MNLPRIFVAPAIIVVAALLCLTAARLAVIAVETRSQDAVKDQLVLMGHDWATVETDGLQVVLSGTAKNEASRFRALSAAGGVVDAARVIDNMTVPAAEAIKPPRFSMEILRNDAGISLIGLIPAATDREALTDQIGKIARDTHVTDLLESADYPVPDNWDDALEFALYALKTLPRSKISMAADRVAITAISDSVEEKTRWEKSLKKEAPRAVLLAVDISAPRPVITPFTLRFLIDEDGARFDACSAHDSVGRAEIISAAVEAGMTGKADCTIGLGVPSPDWPDAVVTSIKALATLEGGSITFSDADVTLVAPATTSQANFDRIVGELEADLPDLYSLHAILPEPVKIDGSGEGSGPPEFVATRSPEGLVQLRGRLSDETQRSATDSFARAAFGTENVYAATRLDQDLPGNWPSRVLAALEALSFLVSGSIVVQPEVIDIRGTTGDPDASAKISRLMGDKLGASEDFRVNVTYQEELDPTHDLPSPQECAGQINALLAESKITFAPGSANIEASAAGTIDKIAEVMRGCADVRMEIAGYTDSQGREEMNRSLSQNRAQAVLNALLARRILTSNLTAKGYGEADPVADNGTEDGREANRRIEFHLLDQPQPASDASENGDGDATAQTEAATATDQGTDAVTEADTSADEAAEPAPAAEGAEDTPPAEAEQAVAESDAPDTADAAGAAAETPTEDDTASEPAPNAQEGASDAATAPENAETPSAEDAAATPEDPEKTPPFGIQAPGADDIRPLPRPER
ncbi:OmpA family protein [Aliiroseovarius marinus]|uniref:OmpA family protein n=1 Tax=Aliiroseovarius marinus TaxID=2500159 RepID=UPI003D7EE352